MKYERYLALFRGGSFRLAVMSSHSNPHGIAFNVAAQRCGVHVVLVTHGMPVRPVAPLSYDLAIVHCEAAQQTYEEEGCRMARVLVHGRRQHHTPRPAAPLAERLAVGVFICKDVKEGRLRELVERLLKDPRVSRVLNGLDHGPQDLHAFVARGLVYGYRDARGLDPDAMQRFYLRPDWPAALRLFSNICEDEADVAARTQDALRELVSAARNIAKALRR